MCKPESNSINKKFDYKSDLRERIETSHRLLSDTIRLFNARVGKEPIDSEQLKAFPYGVWIPLNDRVRVKRRKNRFGNYLCFDTEMQQGGEFGEHFHNDMIESTEVVYGEMFDTYDGKTYKAGDIAHYEKGQTHTPIAVKKTVLHVLFKP